MNRSAVRFRARARFGRQSAQQRPPAISTVAALIAAVLGLGHAAVSAYWAAGGTTLLGWFAAVGLCLYGGVLTVVGVLVDRGVIEASADADHRALAWHAYFWDPWFLLWGVAFALALWCSRDVRRRRRG